MNDYYQKYSKPITPFTLENIILTLNKWNKNITEELEILIYLGNNIKNDSLNKITVYDKKKINEIIEKLKLLTIKIMENINDFLLEINNNKKSKNSEQKNFNKVELIRENYNKIILNNNKFIISNPNLMKLKEEYLKLSRKKLKNIGRNYKKNDFYQIESEEKNNLNPLKNLLNSQNPKKKTNEQFQMDYYFNDIEKTILKTQSNTFSKSYNFSENEKEIFSPNDTLNLNKYSLNLNKSSNQIKKVQNNKMKNNLRKRANSSTFKSVNSFTSLNSNNKNNNINNNNNIKVTQLQNENFELKDEISYMKKKIEQLTELYNKLSLRVDEVQHENNLLRIHNQKLVNFISECLKK